MASAFLVAGSYVLLALVANWLIETLTGQVSETLRDAVFALYWLSAFVALAWLFVRLQGGGRRDVENRETRRSRARSAHEEGARD